MPSRRPADQIVAFPRALDVDTLAAGLLDRGTVLSPVEVDDALLQLPRAEGPVLIAFAHLHGLLAGPDLSRVIGEVWSMAEYPDRELDHSVWRALFAEAGFTSDGHAAARPQQPVRLFRGAVAERRADWSWTDRPDVARSYAEDGIRSRPTGRVWTALVEPARLLARNTGRDESEYVVDTGGLRISEALR